MRQGQPQNRQRSRGRGNNNNRNNNRNQLNRSMESNGPDVRIRGTAAHIAEKYMQLAADAQTSGDTVAAQSYWQFAEHYNRLIAAAQAAQEAQREEQRLAREARGEAEGDDEDNRGRNNRGRGRGRNRDDDGENRAEAEASAADETASVNGEGPQPTLDDVPAEVALNENPQTADSQEAPSKPRRSRRPRKQETPATANEDASALPAFVTGE